MQEARIQALRDAQAKLGGSDREFAGDLISGFAKRRALSDKQWLWVDRLTERATTPMPALPVESVGDFSGVVALFARAQRKLKFPKITLQIGHQPVQLSVAGERSKYPGQVQVTDGGPFGSNQWFGRVDTEGAWTQSRSITAQDLAAVRRLLQDFSRDPAAVAKKHGKLTGRCCFCNTALTDERSTAAGFGPVCAKSYGLEAEWKAATAVLEQEEAVA